MPSVLKECLLKHVQNIIILYHLFTVLACMVLGVGGTDRVGWGRWNDRGHIYTYVYENVISRHVPDY